MELESTLAFDADHPALAGHFPGAPIVPGVLLLDAALHALTEATGRHPSTIASAKFLQPVGPGETLVLRARAAEARGQFDLHSGEARAATGQFGYGDGQGASGRSAA